MLLPEASGASFDKNNAHYGAAKGWLWQTGAVLPPPAGGQSHQVRQGFGDAWAGCHSELVLYKKKTNGG